MTAFAGFAGGRTIFFADSPAAHLVFLFWRGPAPVGI